ATGVCGGRGALWDLNGGLGGNRAMGRHWRSRSIPGAGGQRAAGVESDSVLVITAIANRGEESPPLPPLPRSCSADLICRMAIPRRPKSFTRSHHQPASTKRHAKGKNHQISEKT